MQRASCVPQLEQDWCGRLLKKKLEFGQGTPLLSTTGADWDYCGKAELVEAMQASIQKLHDAKGRGPDKQAHPLFIAFAGPGQGKSRLLTEFPGLLAKCLNNLKKRWFSDEPLPFLLTCENGMGPGDWVTQELNAQRFVACRMLWQLRGANQQEFDGAPTNFAKFRAQCPADLTPEEVIATVLTPEQMKRATVVMGLDGMQNLPGFGQRGKETGKQEPFYQVMQEVCRLVNQDICPFVVACVTATQTVSQALAGSPQARVCLKLPRVMAVTRQRAAAIPDHPLKDLLTMDMGGHGRALECLEESLTSLPNASGGQLVGAVIQSLRWKYPDAASFDGASAEDLTNVLRACLSGKVLSHGQTLGNLDPENMELIRIEYLDSLAQEYRVDIPYIWLQLMLTQKTLAPDLKPWVLMDYEYFEKPEARTWQAWERFNTDFRVLRSCSFEDGQVVDIGLLHRGAIIQPRGFERQEVVNRRLTRVRAKNRLSSRASCCGHPKPQSNSCDNNPAKGLKKLQCRVTLPGNEDAADFVVSMNTKDILVANGNGAPAADAFLMLEPRTAGNDISECLQFKMGSSIVNVTEERGKACDNNDILVLLQNVAAEPPESQNRLVFVSANQFKEYFGLYAGSAFQLQE